jgi:hypothetical protein
MEIIKKTSSSPKGEGVLWSWQGFGGRERRGRVIIGNNMKGTVPKG